MLKDNFDKVNANIQAACDRAGRNREDVTLIAVSKTKPIQMLQEAYDFGVRVFGENKVQEIVDKYEALPKDISWYIIDKVDMIHSVDSLRLAETIEKEAAKKDLIIKILIEVNVAKEESKFGVMPEKVEELVSQVSQLPHIRICGLMTIAPFVENPEENRIYFNRLRNIAVDIERKKSDNVIMSILSMGMTNDYEVAIEEGSTMVRVGTGLFGARNYNQV